jgi:hypothetical protein
MTSKPQTVTKMVKDRETKNKVLYRGDDPDLDRLYLSKKAAEKHGDEISVRVERA